ncbi:alpha-amylase-like [Ptychodera flava]|uniref:alpha-amylase-like n=1 Tax=Ptychodera flava TaxID=63121 RepID=UPI003969E2F8
MRVLLAVFSYFVYFALAQKDANTYGGRQAIVHLFEWKWTDIAAECERFLGPKGFGGVQVSPPNEHRIIYSPSWGTEVKRPWYERYQPISYKLTSRSGSEAEFTDMVQRCNSVGVRIYVDAVFNHMCGEDAGNGQGIAGSSYDTSSYSFPGVPYGSNDFNRPQGKCTSGSGQIENYNDADEVRNCHLSGLMDLDLSSSYVRGKIVDYMNNLIDIGVAGFRVDACKHMWPTDLAAVFGQLKDLNTNYFPAGSRAFFIQEVIDLGGEAVSATEYTGIGRVTEFNFGKFIGEAFRGRNQLKWFDTFGEPWGMLPDGDSLVFVDNHDNQRGHGAGGFNTILSFFEPKLYKMAVVFTLAYPYGFTRLMSSYDWDRQIEGGVDKNDWIGPPHEGDYSTKDVIINADGSCGNDWICEHRWRPITNMVAFRNTAGSESLANWWDNSNNQIAFSRGSKAFIAINNDYSALSATLTTGLPSGQYCDIIHGDFDSSTGTCSGSTVTVDGSGQATIYIDNNDEEPMIAIHVDARVGEASTGIPIITNNPTNGVTNPLVTNPIMTANPVTSAPPSKGWQRTVVFVQKGTSSGQDLFLLGGIGHDVRSGCTDVASLSACALPIKHNIGGTNDKYNSWKTNDEHLDWYGAEKTQGTYWGTAAAGSPMVWTTNKQSHGANVDSDGYGYTPLNQWGDHYWMLDIDMDCDLTESGWFELKAYLQNGDGWESDRAQYNTCTGSAGGSKPYSSGNHFARCGYINVFNFNDNSCIIKQF